MLRRPLALFASAVVAVACGSSSTSLTCPTKAQSLTFKAAGSCGGGNATGLVTISTEPGLCSLTVKGGNTVGLPLQGQFLGAASKTGYDLAQGNWTLFVNQGNAQSGSVDITCDESISGTDVTLMCSGTTCPPDDCGGSAMCSTINCAEHLTPM